MHNISYKITSNMTTATVILVQKLHNNHLSRMRTKCGTFKEKKRPNDVYHCILLCFYCITLHVMTKTLPCDSIEMCKKVILTLFTMKIC